MNDICFAVCAFLFTVRSEPYIIFSGGTSTVSQTPSLTVMHGNNMTVLEMEHPVIDFITLCSTPYNSGECNLDV